MITPSPGHDPLHGVVGHRPGRGDAGGGNAAGHLHAHDHGHDHGPESMLTERVLWAALLLTGGFAVVEAIGGHLAGSLALYSDAGHMATDAAAFVLALIAQRVSRRPPSDNASYGYARAEVLAAFVNAIAMLALVGWIAVEAAQRFFAPTPVAGPLVMAVAACGLAVNLLVAWMLSRSSESLNARGALLHVLGDILGSVAALVAGAIIHVTGWTPIDPLLSLLVALLILRSTWALLKQSGAVLMERVPAHLRYADIGRALAALPGVAGVHDLHIWHLGATRVALSAHVTLARGDDWPAVLAGAQRMLAADFGIDHVTLQPAWPVVPPGRRVIPLVAGRAAGPRAADG
ncbi:MAG: cation transporter [Betaproteobacteria bacterium]|nr:cation transporter [Betaproteobacteria bacterium]